MNRKLKVLKILVFSQVFFPEIGAASNRIYEHAKRWVQNGHSVTVVTNVPNSPFGKIYMNYRNQLSQREMLEGIEVRRVWTLASGKKKHKIHRIISFFVNLLMSMLEGMKCKKPDLVLSSAPYLTGIPGVITSIYHKCPFLYEMRDPWVQVAVSKKTIKKNSLIHKILLRTEEYIAKFAKKVIVIGEEMAEFIKNEMDLPQKPEVVWNGVSSEKIRLTEGKIKPMPLPDFSGKFVIGMIGNLGNQYDFKVIIETAKEVEEENCCFMFLGEGIQKKAVQARARCLGLENVVFYPAVPPNEVPSWFKACDITVVSMEKDPVFDVYLPKKVLDSLIFKIPVLFGGNGEVEKLLNESKGGVTFNPGDKEKLTELIRDRINNKDIMKQESHSGSKFIKENYSRKAMANRYENIFYNTIDEYCK